MPERRITNCHVHSFTHRHVPMLYPHWAVWPFKKVPGLVRLVAFLCRPFFPVVAETLDRLHRFQEEAGAETQGELLEKVRRHYPSNTRFVVLPMDMEGIGHGPVRAGLAAQHDELAALAAREDLKGLVLPFATFNPARGQAGVDEVKRMVEGHGFRGLKIYPRLGFPPDHDLLMTQLYPFLQERGLPVMTHCSRGGVQGRGVVTAAGDRYTAPQAYVPVMEGFPRLRICLAHFGGAADWRAYVEEGMPPGDAEARRRNWQVAIRDMIGSGKYPGLWTDISYTLFHFDDNLPFLKLFLEGTGDKAERLRRRVLFGSDYYMTRQERLSERAVCFRLRNALGEDLFWRIAQVNPEVWLGERGEEVAEVAGAGV